MTIKIVEVLRRSDQGMTRPFICRGDDRETYFVKGIGAGRRSQICEWIAGRLAELVGLPIAPFKVVDVSEELLMLDGGLDLSELGVGFAFGSQERQVTELTVSTVEQIPQSLQQDVLIFDWWVRNGDRCLTEHGGNPNLFWEPGNRELVVIDHNQAFDSDVNKDIFCNCHVFHAQTNELSGDSFRCIEIMQRFTSALESWTKILEEIPDTWWYADPELTVPVDFDAKAVYNLLKGFENEEFWNWK